MIFSVQCTENCLEWSPVNCGDTVAIISLGVLSVCHKSRFMALKTAQVSAAQTSKISVLSSMTYLKAQERPTNTDGPLCAVGVIFTKCGHLELIKKLGLIFLVQKLLRRGDFHAVRSQAINDLG